MAGASTRVDQPAWGRMDDRGPITMLRDELPGGLGTAGGVKIEGHVPA